jgi:putative peptidoglycan lipid II flippase
MSAAAPRSREKSAFLVMVAIFGSRIMGLVREVILGMIFGASNERDALIAAFRIPNLLRDLLAEGALSTAFVTTFSKRLETEGKVAAFRLANLVTSHLAVLMIAICLLGMALSGPLVHLFNPGFFDIPGKGELTIGLTRILFPFIGLVSMAAIWMGLLNSLGSFGLPASASTAFNIVSICAGLAVGYLIDPSLGPHSIYGFAAGAVIGGFAQWWIQVPRSRQLGYRYSWVWNWSDPGLRQVMRLMGPAVIGGAAVQVNVLVNGYFASYFGAGAVTCLDNAFRLMQLPIGMFGVAVAMVTLPTVSRMAAAEDMPGFRARIESGVRLAFFMTLPAAVGLFVMAEPVLRMIFQHGVFTRAAANQAAVLLSAYAVGLTWYAGIKVVAPAFYALDKPMIPLRVSLFGIAVNAVANATLIGFFHVGLVSLPLTTSVVAALNFGQLGWAMRRHFGQFLTRDGWEALGRMLAAAAAMGLVVWGMREWTDSWATGGFLLIVQVALCVGAGTLLYAGITLMFRMEEATAVTGLVLRKVKR